MLSLFKLTPKFFIFSEFFILVPSLLLLVGIFLSLFQNNNSLYYLVSGGLFLRSIFIGIIMPVAGGFLSYQYLERYAPAGFIKKIAKITLGYSIIEIGIFSLLLFLR